MRENQKTRGWRKSVAGGLGALFLGGLLAGCDNDDYPGYPPYAVDPPSGPAPLEPTLEEQLLDFFEDSGIWAMREEDWQALVSSDGDPPWLSSPYLRPPKSRDNARYYPHPSMINFHGRQNERLEVYGMGYCDSAKFSLAGPLMYGAGVLEFNGDIMSCAFENGETYAARVVIEDETTIGLQNPNDNNAPIYWYIKLY